MEIRPVDLNIPKLPDENPEQDAVFDLDLKIQTLVKDKELGPLSRGCGVTNTCKTPCGTCVNCYPIP
jgi:hypothetical protein